MEKIQKRQVYNKYQLDENQLQTNPMDMFVQWFEEAETHSRVPEYYTMSVSTVDADNCPRTRIVLLKEYSSEGFVFYTNYDSRKGKSLSVNNKACLHFFWPDMQRQVIIKAILEKVPVEQSDQYFAERPRGSQIGAHVSPQSKIIPNREFLSEKFEQLNKVFEGKTIPRPDNWGGFLAKPYEIEFWQGRENRLHDRILYRLSDAGEWGFVRLAP